MLLLRRIAATAAASALALAATPAAAGAQLPVPPVVDPPAAAPGQQVTCTHIDPSATFRWMRDGVEVGSGATYTVQAADALPSVLVCRATIDVLLVGEQEVDSLPVAVLAVPELPDDTLTDILDDIVSGGDGTDPSDPTGGDPTAGDPGTGDPVSGGEGAPARPAATLAPGLSGRAVVGRNLSCTRGSWTGAPSVFLFRWARGTELIPGAERARYGVARDDVGQDLRCVVVAGNQAGYGIALSRSVQPRAVTDARRPVVRKFKLRAKKRVRGKRRRGKFTWKLSERAKTKIVVQRCRKVRRSGSCKRWKRVGKLAKAGKKGRNAKKLRGRLARRMARPGRYRATVVARDAAGNKSKRRRAKRTLRGAARR